MTTVYLVSGTSWADPGNTNGGVLDNVDTIGGGGGASTGNSYGAGGGAYAGSTAVTVTFPVTYAIGAGGTGTASGTDGGNGGDTCFGAATLAGGGILVGAQGGRGGLYGTGAGLTPAAGGLASASVGTTKFSGGTGGANDTNQDGASGGGGAAGPNGAGANGGDSLNTDGGSGGGGANGGSVGGSAGTGVKTFNGANGGNNRLGSGGGAGGAGSAAANPVNNGSPGTNGGGGGGGGGTNDFTATPNGGVGGAGSTDPIWDATHGPGGGGGGGGGDSSGGSQSGGGGAAGLYGGGAGPGGWPPNSGGPAGAQGIIRIVYTASAYRFVQGVENDTFSGASSITATLPSAVTAGNAILIGWTVSPSASAPTSISDGVNTYTIGATQLVTVSGDVRYGHAYAFGIAAGTPTITLTVAGATTGLFFFVEEYSGLATTAAFDGASVANGPNAGGSPDNFNSGSFTPTQSGDLIWCYAQIGNGSGLTPGAGFALAFDDVANSGYKSEYRTQATAAAIAPNWTVTGSFNEVALAAAFKAPSTTLYILAGQACM